MQSVKSLAKAVSKEMADSLKGTEELLTLALTKAQKDNNTVYLERVPVFAGRWGSDPIDQIGLHCRRHPHGTLVSGSSSVFVVQSKRLVGGLRTCYKIVLVLSVQMHPLRSS